MSIRNGKDLKIDPLATLFPPMAEEEFARLKADIAARGQLEPIWTHRGRVVDGRHRLRACRELGLEPIVREYDGDSTVLGFVIAKNLHRRHLSANQRALVAAKLANLSGGRPSKTARKQAVTQSDAAALLKVGRTTVQGARQVLNCGVPELVAAVERDAIKIAAAAAVATLDNAELAELVARGPKAVRQRAAQLRMTTKTKVEGGPSTEDRDYLESCPVRAQLADPALFDRQALILHRLRPVLERLGREFPEAFEDGAWRGPIGAFASTRLDRLMFVRDAREWTLCTFCMGTGTEQSERGCAMCDGGGFEVLCYDPDPYESCPTGARTPTSEGRRIGRHQKERRT
jgi:ParB-like chromosome segregation protein Spo0J